MAAMAKWPAAERRRAAASTFIGGFRSKLDGDFESIIDVGCLLARSVGGGRGATPSSLPSTAIRGKETHAGPAAHRSANDW